jgi:AcrR family transcriptional regulator
MKNPRLNIGSIRREQVVDAAVAVIAEQGLQRLSLSEIEKRVGMARGHLMYYFPAKEDILLAVFDRLLQLMCQRNQVTGGRDFDQAPPDSAAEAFRLLLPGVMGVAETNPEFHALQYTFLSQIGHREDFRRRLASLYEEWRTHMARRLSDDRAEGKTARAVPPRTMASLIQAILHGLAVQLAADPNAFDRQEMMDLCLDVVGSYLGARPPGARRNKKVRHKAPPADSSRTGEHRPKRPQGVHHE